MKIAIITINKEGEDLSRRLKTGFANAKIINTRISQKGTLKKLVKTIFNKYEGLIFIAALGITVRLIAEHVKSKFNDPAVVSLDSAGRFSISVLSGHEGGANELAIRVGNVLSAEPVITTGSEARKKLVIGVGCRRGIKKEEIIKAIEFALRETRSCPGNLRYIATIDLKQAEKGLKDASRDLGVPLRIIPASLVKNFSGKYQRSSFVKEKIGVEGVSEPCALIASGNSKLILSKRKVGNVTVAVAQDV